jgi:beta-lactamase regulating signal transducer with metallopeptidase domain
VHVVHARVSTTWRVDRGIEAPVSVERDSPSATEDTDARASVEATTPTPVLVLSVWLLGCLAIRPVCHWAPAHWPHHRQLPNPLSSFAWSSALESASIDLGVIRDVDLLVSDALSAPITSGFFRPVVILPADCSTWTAERRRIVLVHELAHIARLDYLAQLVATLACAIFWFHPAVWFAAGQLRAEAEHAADDRVLGAGTLGVTYATHLLELAGDHDSALTRVAVGMIVHHVSKGDSAPC